jgi:hypothetical protein
MPAGLMSRRRERTYEDYEEMGRYLWAAYEAISEAQGKSFEMFGGLEALTEGTATMETRPAPTSYDDTILELAVTLEHLISELATNFYAEIDESQVPPGKPRIPPPFERGEPA